MADVGALYRQTRERITGLVSGLDAEGAQTPVPACPGWTVKDVVAHLSGVCADILARRLDGVATDPWTARQVEERRDWEISRVLEEWNEIAPKCEELSQHFPPDAATQWVTDLTTHEHDIRTALGRPDERDNEAVAVAFRWLVGAVGGDHAPALRFVTPEGDDLVMGSGEPDATVRASRFDFMRAITGRRSPEQIAAFEWDGDHAKHLGAFSQGPFTMATSPILE